ncbi:MAG: hypothetical protein ACRCTJ_06270 [Brevinema sp.]
MPLYIYLFFLTPMILFSSTNNVFDEFHQLRSKHLGELAAKSFSAELNQSDAKKLLGDRIKGVYRVEVLYDARTGVEFLVKDTEHFYERALSQYTAYINMMLLPLLSTLGYEKLQDRFQIKKISEDQQTYYVSYHRGDIETVYILKVGTLGLVDKVVFLEDKKKKFATEIQWVKYKSQYVPQKIKTISYEGTRSVGVFQIIKVQTY